jgi:hypothetical protein
VSAVCPTHHPVLKTHALRQHHAYSGFRPLHSLVQAIQAAEPDLIIPCDDRAVEHLHELYANAPRALSNDIRDLISRSLGAPSNYPVITSRYDLLMAAREEGIDTPDTARLSNVAALETWRVDRQPPWVLKGDGGSGGRSVRVVQSLAAAKGAFVELSSPPRFGQVAKWLIVDRDSFWLRPWWSGARSSVTVQSYIEGTSANCAVACWEGRVLAGLGAVVLESKRETGPAVVVRLVECPEMMRAAELLVRRLGLSGFVGLDFVVEKRSGRFYLIEMNPRSTQLCHLQMGPGRDMVAALYSHLTGHPYKAAPPVTNSDLVSYFPAALTSQSPHLASSFHDVPEDAPELVEALLHPWPDRSVLFRLYGHLAGVLRPGLSKRSSIAATETGTAAAWHKEQTRPSGSLPHKSDSR